MSDNDDKILAEQNAFHLVKALDLIDECYHFLKAHPPSKKTMSYSKWESLVEECDYMREFNADAEHERINRDDKATEAQRLGMKLSVMSDNTLNPMESKKKVSRFEFAIMQAAGIDQSNVEPKTKEEEEQERINKLRKIATQIRVKKSE